MYKNVHYIGVRNKSFICHYIAGVYRDMKNRVEEIKRDYSRGKIARSEASRSLSNLIDRNNTEKQNASNVSELEKLCGLEDLIKEAVAEL